MSRHKFFLFSFQHFMNFFKFCYISSIIILGELVLVSSTELISQNDFRYVAYHGKKISN